MDKIIGKSMEVFKITVKKLLKYVLLTIIIIILIIIVMCISISYSLSKYMPSSGIWQYSDGNLDIIIYVPPDGGILLPPHLACKAEISYKGEKQKAVLLYNTKHYQLDFALIDDYADIVNSDVKFNYIFHSTYVVPMKRGEWEFKGGKFSKPYNELLKEYKYENLILKKIGKYKDPE